MSENNSAQDKTEQPTPKRQQDAVNKGDVAQSKDLSSFLIMGFVGVTLYFSAKTTAKYIFDIFEHVYVFDKAVIVLSNKMLFSYFFTAIVEGVKSIFFVLFAAFFISFLSGFVLRGKFTYSIESLGLKLEKLDPVKGFKRMFSLNSFVEMIKSVLKFFFILCFAFVGLYLLREQIHALSKIDVTIAIYSMFNIISNIFLILLLPLFIICLIDVPYQLWSYAKKLRMTKQEIKDENKNTEGNPEVKGRIRAIQRSQSQRKMLQDVPTANAVIVNPDHYAVALRYEHDSNVAPIVVAKGVDHMADRIKTIARENSVVVYREPPLARSLYYSVDVGKAIPAGLYLAVAKILAYLYQVENNLRNEKNQLPDKPSNLDIPEEYKY